MPLQLGRFSSQCVEFSRGLFRRQAVQVSPVTVIATSRTVGVANALTAAGGGVHHSLEAAAAALVVDAGGGNRGGNGGRGRSAARSRRFSGDASS